MRVVKGEQVKWIFKFGLLIVKVFIHDWSKSGIICTGLITLDLLFVSSSSIVLIWHHDSKHASSAAIDTGLRAKLLLYLNECSLELLNPAIFDLAFLTKTVDDLVEALDVLFVLNLLLTYDSQLLHLTCRASLTCPKVAHDRALLGSSLSHWVRTCVLNRHRVCKDRHLRLIFVQLTVLARQVYKQRFVLKVNGCHCVVRVLLVPLFLKVRKKAPTKKANWKFGVGLCAVDFDLLDELAESRWVTRHDLLLERWGRHRLVKRGFYHF